MRAPPPAPAPGWVPPRPVFLGFSLWAEQDLGVALNTGSRRRPLLSGPLGITGLGRAGMLGCWRILASLVLAARSCCRTSLLSLSSHATVSGESFEMCESVPCPASAAPGRLPPLPLPFGHFEAGPSPVTSPGTTCPWRWRVRGLEKVPRVGGASQDAVGRRVSWLRSEDPSPGLWAPSEARSHPPPRRWSRSPAHLGAS